MTWESPSLVAAHRSFQGEGRLKDHGSAQCCRTVRSGPIRANVRTFQAFDA